MKILKIYPILDNPRRYNYHINYGVWDEIDGHNVHLEHFNADLNNYDVVFLPMYKRWEGHFDLLHRIKSHSIKKVLFDNDSCFRKFEDEFYAGIDYVFYRGPDRWGRTPMNKGSLLRWSVDANKYAPKYGGEGVVFNCYVNNAYPLRKKIAEFIKNTTVTGDEYIKLLQKSAGAIHTNSERSLVVRAKAVEFASCGTHIISNRIDFSDYFPNEAIIFFDTLDDLKDIIKDFTPIVKQQKLLRTIVESDHTNKQRASEVLDKIYYL